MVASPESGAPERQGASAIELGATVSPLLRVEHLSVHFPGPRGPLSVVDDVSFDIAAGETVCLVGESGSGKTMTALSVLRLEEQRSARVMAGRISLAGTELVGASPRRLDELRGRRVGMIFQEPMTAFDPVFSIGSQIVETIVRHEHVERKLAWQRALRLLERVQVPDAALRMRQIPEELSGGMRQRAMIAMALACSPELLIADEPTTALDVTTEAQILELLRDLQRENGMAILLITHDLAIAAEMADRVVVMYAGRIVERARVAELFREPLHPYTRGLLGSAISPRTERGQRLRAIAGSIPHPEHLPSGCRFQPRCPRATERCRAEPPLLTTRGAHDVACFTPLLPVSLDPPACASSPAHSASSLPSSRHLTLVTHTASPLIEALGVSKHYASRGLFSSGKGVHALDAVSLSIRCGETLGLVGESGCGKSTLGRILLDLERPSAGEVRFAGKNIKKLSGLAQRQLRREAQMIFQDPYGSIDPRWSAADVIAEPLVAQGERSRDRLRDRVHELLEMVGLEPASGARFAHEFSGGQRQRIGIARAIAHGPKFIVADEAVSALDLSVQAQILNLLLELRGRLGLTCLFIGHGLHVVRHVSDRIGVMYVGRLVELADAEELFARPIHHYTAALLAALPAHVPGVRRVVTLSKGELPSPTSPPSGCRFHPRCPAASERCRSEAPLLRLVSPKRLVACHHPRE